MKRPDLIIMISIWQFFTAFGALAGILGIAVYALPATLGVFGDSFINLFGLNITPLIGGVVGLSIASMCW